MYQVKHYKNLLNLKFTKDDIVLGMADVVHDSDHRVNLINNTTEYDDKLVAVLSERDYTLAEQPSPPTSVYVWYEPLPVLYNTVGDKCNWKPSLFQPEFPKNGVY
jgi:hypothetical protein